MAVTLAEPDTPGRNTVARNSETNTIDTNTTSAHLRDDNVPPMKTPESKSLRSPAREAANTPSTSASTPSSPTSGKAATAPRQFFAIRKGRGVSQCIFSSWEHAKQHVENYRDAIYNVFDRMDDAMSYIQLPARRVSSSTCIPLAPCSSTTAKKSNATSRKRTLPSSNRNTNNIKKHCAIVPTSPKSNAQPMSCDKENQDGALLAPRSTGKKDTTSPNDVPQEIHDQVDDDETDSIIGEQDSRDLPEILDDGYRKSYPKGWRANDLFPARRQDRSRWEKRYLQDVNDLKAYRATKPSSARDVHNMRHSSGIPNAFSLAYLNFSWGVGEAYHRYLAFQQRKTKPVTSASNKHRTKSNKLKVAPANRSNHYSCSTCVITNRDAARKRFNAKAMFYSFRVQQLAEMVSSGLTKDQLPGRVNQGNDAQRKSPLVNGCSRSKELMDEARADWDTLSDEDRAYWEEQEREHDARQPQIRRILEEALAREPKRSAKKLSEDIDFWCGKTTIGKWKNLRIGPSYRKGIANPVPRSSQKEHLLAISMENATPQVPTTSRAVSVTNSTLAYSPPHINAAKMLVALPEVHEARFGCDENSSESGNEEPSPAPCTSLYSSRRDETMISSYQREDDDDNMII
jgi:Caulimovirus viroplasmin